MPAGYNPGTGLSCARGCAAGRCSAIGLSCVRFVPGVRSYRNVLRSITPAVCRIAPNRTACGSVARFAFVHAGACDSGGAVCRHSRRGLQFYCGVLPSVHAGRAVLLRCFAVVHAGACSSIAVFCRRFTPVFFPLSGKKRRLAISCVSIPPGRDRHSCVLGSSVRLSGFVGSLRACAFFYGDPDRERKERRDAENGVGGAALVRFCAGTLALICFPRGVRWGCAPQTCAKESSTLWTLFTLRRGWVDAYTRRRPGTRKDPPESNLCSGGSGCIKMLPTRSIVQTRSAPKR